jgi:DNA-binding LytR/AlgR family response regulator
VRNEYVVAIVLVSDPELRWRIALSAIVEALGHDVVHDLDRGPVDVIVIEPMSRESVALAREARGAGAQVVCVTGGRRMIGGWLLEPVAYLEKPVQVGPFVRTIERALERTQQPAAAAA